MSITFAPDNIEVQTYRWASVIGPATIACGAFFMLYSVVEYMAAAVSTKIVPIGKRASVLSTGQAAASLLLPVAGQRGKYQSWGMAADGRLRLTTQTCPMSNQSSPRRRANGGTLSGKNQKILAKSFGVTQETTIFAASNQTSGQNAAGTHPAIFVPTTYRNHRITMPCRVSGNRPGVSACLNLTARSMVNFLCQIQTSMQIRKQINLTLILLALSANYERVRGRFSAWCESESVWFSAWCGERVTNREVVATAGAVCVAFPLLMAVMGLVLGGGAA